MVADRDLLELTAELVDISSVSHHEQAIADRVAELLDGIPGLDLTRIGDNLIARTNLGRPRRVVLAGHTDTVVPVGNDRARVDGDECHGVGSADMKSGLAVMCALARARLDPVHDLTWIFYVAEEVAARFNGLGLLFEQVPELVAGDVAVLLEPTGAVVEAGCQGTLRVAAEWAGLRAHTARPWMGRNAIHRLSDILSRLDSYSGRRVVIDGCEYREAVQAVAVEGGVAGNVVPDRVVLTLNHRFAPDRTDDEAISHVRGVVGDCDRFEVLDCSPGAPPGLRDSFLADLVKRSGKPARAKLGWTDVARFAARGIPSANFGPGDPELAHTPEERVGRKEIETVHRVLGALLTEPV
ncbi:MAG: succinyl-diaminopimelate desuccinylase [Acidimicrobiales bacterium]